MGMETSFTDMVRSVIDGWWSSIHGRRGREFYCAGSIERETTLAFSMRRVGLFFADDLCGGREAVRRGGGRVGAVYVCAALKSCAATRARFIGRFKQR